MATVAETNRLMMAKNVIVANSPKKQQQQQQQMIEEDGDSRDSGISMGSFVGDDETSEKIGEISGHHRLALVDCSNFVAKNLVNNSSRHSTNFYRDTPTSRKTKSVFGSDTIEQSKYEIDAEQRHQQMTRHSSQSISELTTTNHDLSSLSRKRSSSSTSSTTLIRKRSKQITIEGIDGLNDEEDGVGGKDEDDEVFFHDTSLKSLNQVQHHNRPPSISLWDMSNMSDVKRNIMIHSNYRRNASDDSFNESFRANSSAVISTNGKVKTYRALSAGFVEPDAPLPAMLEVKYSLPAVERPQKESQAYRSISPLTLLKEFQRLGDDFHSTYIVVDCRYSYEYEGGHIRGAINVYNSSGIEPIFFPVELKSLQKKRIPIFYCEFSQKRGPTMANTLRSIDRVRNELKYPHVEYPEIYLLDHGYKSLWNTEACREICEPCNYVPMDHPEFLTQLRSFRGARLRSNALGKSNLEWSRTGSVGGGGAGGEREGIKCGGFGVRRKISQRSLRKNASFMSIHSKLSFSNSLGLGRSVFDLSRMDDPFAMESLTHSPLKSISAFDINSTVSEVDLDQHIDEAFSTKTAEKENIQPQVDSLHTVQLAIKIETPDFSSIVVEKRNSDEHVEKRRDNEDKKKGEGEGEEEEEDDDEEESNPRAFLNFSEISDTE